MILRTRILLALSTRHLHTHTRLARALTASFLSFDDAHALVVSFPHLVFTTLHVFSTPIGAVGSCTQPCFPFDGACSFIVCALHMIDRRSRLQPHVGVLVVGWKPLPACVYVAFRIPTHARSASTAHPLFLSRASLLACYRVTPLNAHHISIVPAPLILAPRSCISLALARCSRPGIAP